MQSSQTFLWTLGLLSVLGVSQIGAQTTVPLGEALDAPGLVWSTIGSSPWEGQTALSHDGVDAAASGVVTDGSAATIQTTVTGPGTISFWWKVSSEWSNDFLKFFIGGYQQVRISGEVNWQLQTFSVPAGVQILKWTYSKNASNSAGVDRGWVDQVQYATVSNCTYSISPVASSQGADAAIGTISVATLSNCPWTVSNTNTWVHISTGTINSGNGTVMYDVAANASTTARQATLMIAGQSVVISQEGAPDPNPSVIPLSQAVDTTGLVWFNRGATPWTGQVSISHDGTDAAQSGSVPDSSFSSFYTTVTGPGVLSFWWKVSSEAASDRLRFLTNGTEAANISGEVNWTVRTIGVAPGLQNLEWKYTKNSSLSAGQDRGWVDEIQYTSTAGCAFTLSAANASHAAVSSTGSVSVAATAGCGWYVLNTNAWVAILSGGGNGDGIVRYLVTENYAGSRIGYILIAGQPFAITQLAPGACTYAISPSTRTHGYGATTNFVTVSTAMGCPWSVVNTNLWLMFSGAGSGSAPYSLAANPSSQSRTGTANIAGQPFTVTQLGVSCTYTLSPTSRDHGATAESGAINVNTILACSWNASTTNSWITIVPGTNNAGTGIVNYTLSANSNWARTGGVQIAGQSFTIHQSGGQAAGGTPSVTLAREQNGDVTLSFSGILQSSPTVNGTFTDVSGNPQGSYTIQKGSLELKRFFRTRNP